LRNVLDSAVVMAEGNEIQAQDLGIRDAESVELESLRIDHWEKKLIVEALKRTGGNMPDSAKMLGISRATLYRKLDEYQISKPD
jgi:transcriptional regulator of acetoin/glycerol metabolism